MRRSTGFTAAWVAMLAISTSGCQSPHRADQGAMLGGVGGGVLGAIVGNQTGNSEAGAALGALTGMIAGSAIGNEIDEIEANQARIESQLGHRIAAGAVSTHDVIMMTNAGVEDEVIVKHIQNHGVAGPLTAHDLIFLNNAGVSSRVVTVMQDPPKPPVAVAPASRPVYIEERYISPDCHWAPPRRRHHRHHPRPAISFSLHN